MNNSMRRLTGLRPILALVFIPVIACGQQDDPVDPTVEKQALLENSGTVLYETSKGTVVQDGDWIRRRYVEPLSPNAVRTIYRGTRTEQGGCAFRGTGSNEQLRNVMIIERTIAKNANQCLMETERATLQAAEAVARGFAAAKDSEGGDRDIGAGQEGGSELQLQNVQQFSWSFRTYLEDPVALDTTAVRSNVEFSTNGSCMTGWHRWPDWYWFGPSGWSRGSYGERGTTGGTLPCNEIWQQSWGFFSNWWFCGFTPTFADHADNQFHVFSNVSASWSWSTNWYGACYWLLDHNITVDLI